MSRIVEVSVRHAKTKVSAVSVIRVVHALDKLRGYRCPEGSLSVAFLGDKETAKLHDDFLGDPTVTDVITFVGEDHPGEPFAGEICVNIDQARRAAKEHGVTLATELRLYVAHGWLHLAGLRDHNKQESVAMRVGEAVAVSHLDKFRVKLSVRN
ncbi:MAG: rRNA maturation RNase YbeY [Verrucomicrobiota bacterium]|jgi:probable rRNA maturation factor